MKNDFIIKKTYLSIFLGVILGYFLFIYPAVIFYAGIIFIINYFLQYRIISSEKNFVLKVFYIALFLRLALIGVTHILAVYFGFGPESTTFPELGGGGIIGDDIGIHQRAWALANTLRGEQISEKAVKILLKDKSYGWSFHSYFLGFFYYIFGTVPLLGKCINALFGVLAGVLVYGISKEIFNIKTAKVAYILMVFYPTLLVWSITNLKDIVIIFMLTAAIFCYISFKKEKKMKYLIAILLSCFFLALYRLEVSVILSFAMSVFFIIDMKWKFKKIVIAGIIAFVILFGKSHVPAGIEARTNINNIIANQAGHVTSGISGYRTYPERFYEKNQGQIRPINTGEFIWSLTKGTLSLFFRPLPWNMYNTMRVVYYPVILMQYLLFFFLIIGLFMCWKHRIKNFGLLLFILCAIVFSLSLSEGNVGTMIRHRDMLMPVWIIFSSFGIADLFFGKTRK